MAYFYLVRMRLQLAKMLKIVAVLDSAWAQRFKKSPCSSIYGSSDGSQLSREDTPPPGLESVTLVPPGPPPVTPVKPAARAQAIRAPGFPASAPQASAQSVRAFGVPGSHERSLEHQRTRRSERQRRLFCHLSQALLLQWDIGVESQASKNMCGHR